MSKLHPLNFYAVTQIAPWSGYATRTYSFDTCTETATEFSDNMLRVYSMTGIPGMAFMDGEDWEEACAFAVERLPGSTRTSQPVEDLAVKTFLERRQDLGIEGYHKRYFQASKNAEDINTRYDVSHAAYHGLLQSLAIQAWTMFEVMAERLHTKSRELHPDCFPAHIPTEKYYFRKLKELFRAYERAFDNDPDVRAALINADTKGLALLRHVLVHQNGVADETFKKQCATQPVVTMFDAFPEKKPILLTGDIMRSLLDSCIKNGYGLMRAVDTWLTNHQPVKP